MLLRVLTVKFGGFVGKGMNGKLRLKIGIMALGVLIVQERGDNEF
jgi:hypothetical protein